MKRVMRFNIIQAVTWSVVAIAAGVIFAMPDTINNWGDNRVNTIILACLFIIGFGTDFVIRMVEKTKKYNDELPENEKNIEYRAGYIGFFVLFIYIFFVSIKLYTEYKATGLMPVGWVWFIAYSSIIIANLATSISSIIFTRAARNNAEEKELVKIEDASSSNV